MKYAIEKRYFKPESGAVLQFFLGIFAIGALLAVSYYLFACPCERMPGGYLLGEEVTETIEDWSFVNQTGLCQIQVAAVLPHSVNLNCMSTNGNLYLSCASCDGKYWSNAAVANPEARLRVDGRVYPVSIRRVQDAQTRDIAWQARAAKLKQKPGTPPAEGWWTFSLVSRN